MSALASCASCKPLAIESGECLVSASVNSSHFPFATFAPLQAALHLPLQPGRQDRRRSISAPQSSAAMARVPSVEWSSTTMISYAGPAWPTSDRKQSARHASSFRAGTMTETSGAASPSPIQLKGTRRLWPHVVHYYSSVKRFISSTILVCVLLLAACNSGSHPPRIGNAAPEFTVTDSQRTVSLNQFHGKPVVLNFWATWCPPCVQEMPSLVQLQKQLGDKVTILAVSEDDDDSAYKQFVRDHNVDLLTVRDTRQKATSCMAPSSFLRPS